MKTHLIAAARYVALNPAPARLAGQAQDRSRSSVRAHLTGRDDGLVSVKPLLDRAPRFADLIEGEADFDPIASCVRPARRSKEARAARH